MGGVSFVAGRASSFIDAGKTITYDESDETGEGFDFQSGVFTVPKKGKYMFFFHAKSEEAQTTVSIRLNGAETLVTSSYLLAARQDLNKGGEISMKTVANLDIGNTISVFLEEGKLQEKPVFAGKIILP